MSDHETGEPVFAYKTQPAPAPELKACDVRCAECGAVISKGRAVVVRDLFDTLHYHEACAPEGSNR